METEINAVIQSAKNRARSYEAGLGARRGKPVPGNLYRSTTTGSEGQAARAASSENFTTLDLTLSANPSTGGYTYNYYSMSKDGHNVLSDAGEVNSIQQLSEIFSDYDFTDIETLTEPGDTVSATVGGRQGSVDALR